MIKKPTKQRQIRKKVAIEDDDDNIDRVSNDGSVSNEEPQISAVVVKSKPKNKAKPKKTVGLSFEADNETGEDGFQIKKSAASRRLKKLGARTVYGDIANTDNRLQSDESTRQLSHPNVQSTTITITPSVVDDDADDMDFYTLNSAKVTQSNELKPGESMNIAVDLDERDQMMDEDDDELKRWELEQIRRGGALQEGSMGGKAEMALNAAHQAIGAIKMPRILPIPSLDNVQSSLIDAEHHLRQVYSMHVNELEGSRREIQELQKALETLESDLQIASDRYDYFQQLKTFMFDFVEFMDEKFPEIESLEQRWNEILKDRVDQSVSIRLETFLLSDNITLPESTERQSKIDEVKREINAVFEDVDEEFQNPNIISKRFETWKSKFRVEYVDAFGSLSLPGVFEIHVRKELLDWDPFMNVSDLDQMKWHQTVSAHEYGPSMNTAKSEDPDAMLLNKVIMKSVVPRLKSIIRYLDPFSQTQVRNLKEVLEQILYVVDRRSDPFQTLISSLSTVFIESIEMAVSQLSRLRDSDGPPSPIVYRNCFNLAMKLWKNICTMKKYFSDSTIQNLLIDSLLNRWTTVIYEMIEPMVDDISAFQMIVDTVPKEWIGDGFKTPERYESLAKSIIVLSNHIQKNKEVGRPEFEKIVKMLVFLRSYDNAARIAKLYQIK
ncbi:hypothetical protein BKA69DRAFT_864394 [Paraphysoderma sedebokerense]|nr:hypothetical protein BKA69DRAFT_864394 [Paraphysoderma sedebokerense]